MVNNLESCVDHLGGLLFFDSKNSKGGVANVLGSTAPNPEPFPIAVSTFTCQKI